MGHASASRPLLLRHAKERQLLSGLSYHYDVVQQLNVTDQQRIPVLMTPGISLLKTQGVVEDNTCASYW
ncbi:hypothetical protein [Bradyrhizobium cosmicum]|uniref:hypothetical protein n=1 Tax=Bradyrhizobium cosmicum TaxID=1404864 RepID=UPI0028E69117|nr:hypothetical protein [Bradyrhizobium cosmicum]